VPQITASAGLTTRTFFRYFADKREVIFGGEEIPAFAARIIAQAPAGLDPIDLIVNGLRTVAETRFDGRRDEVLRLRAIIRSDASLRTTIEHFSRTFSTCSIRCVPPSPHFHPNSPGAILPASRLWNYFRRGNPRRRTRWAPAGETPGSSF
jgi:AcrR family transcriptional regulator